MDNPLVSVIIPVYNGEKYLAEAIESVLAQTYQPVEIIVVDDGSMDKSAQIAQSYPVKFIYQPNQGCGMAKHMGILNSRGEFLAFLDQDDLWIPEKLKAQIEYLQENPEIGYVICNMQNFLDSDYEHQSWPKQAFLDRPIAAYIPSALVVRRSVLEKIGDFDPSYQVGSDTDWFFRASDAGISMANLNQTLLRRRIHPDNGSHLHTKGSLSHQELFRSVKYSLDRKRRIKPSPK